MNSEPKTCLGCGCAATGEPRLASGGFYCLSCRPAYFRGQWYVDAASLAEAVAQAKEASR